jgi:hypothetical protein
MGRQLVVLALALAGCGRQAPSPAPAPAPAVAPKTVPGFDSIRLARTACFGHCPVYQIEIRKSGKATFTGEEFVTAKGVRELQLREDDVVLLAVALKRTAFWSLKDRYFEKEDGCGPLMTDMPSFSIQVVRDGKSKTVNLYEGCQGAAVPSEALNWMANTIDYVANTRPLIADPEPFK